MEERLLELTRNDIMKDIQTKVKKRSSVLQLPTYVGITKDYRVVMRAPSSTGKGSYYVVIKLVEYPSIEDIEDIDTREKVRLALAGDLAVYCSCPAFKWWGYEYIMTNLDSNPVTNQNIYPKIRNPKLEGTLCKHAYRAFKMFGSYWSSIAKDLDERNFLRSEVIKFGMAED